MLATDQAILVEKLRDNPAEISAYLTDKFDENLISKAREALSVVMRAQNVQMLARDAGLRRDALYRTFSGRIDPQLSRVLKLFEGLSVAAHVIGFEGQEAIANHLSQALNHPSDAIGALSTVVKSQNVTALATELGIMRTTVYKTFGGSVDPQLGRVLNLFAVMRVRLAIVPALPTKVRPPRPKLGRPRKGRD